MREKRICCKDCFFPVSMKWVENGIVREWEREILCAVCGKVTKISESCWCLRVFPLRVFFLSLLLVLLPLFFPLPPRAVLELGEGLMMSTFATPALRPHHDISPHLILLTDFWCFLLPFSARSPALTLLSLCAMLSQIFHMRAKLGCCGMRCVFLYVESWVEWAAAAVVAAGGMRRELGKMPRMGLFCVSSTRSIKARERERGEKKIWFRGWSWTTYNNELNIYHSVYLHHKETNVSSTFERKICDVRVALLGRQRNSYVEWGRQHHTESESREWKGSSVG